MMQIDRAGCFRGKPAETGVGTTKNGFPQFVARLVATERYVESADELKALGLEGGPQWVDWSAYESEITGRFCLYGNAKDANKQVIPGEMVALEFQFENLNRALGWDGASLAVLGSTDYTQQVVTFWVEEHEWQGNTDLQVNGIDAADADPSKSIRKLDGDKLKDLDARFAGIRAGAKPTAAAAKPVKAGPSGAPKAPGAPVAKGAPGKPATASVPTVATPKTTTAPAAVPGAAASPSKPPPKGPPKKVVTTPAVEEAPFDAETMTQEEAWNKVYELVGKAGDNKIAETWMDVCGKVAPGKEEGDITGEQYVQIAKQTIAVLKS